ncbi:hypothetical protein ABDK00_004060 [Niabella insulamsoli]|uniref:hypothetical protein n=1 Tax=Niabella insulamsoli TaxID=3144874 RepID=UPI0031FCFD0A
MKFFAFLSIVFLLGCQKQPSTEIADIAGEMTVIRDCTGTYLRHNNLDYWICNQEKLENFETNTTLTASIKKSVNCKIDGMTCYLYHKNEGVFKVLTVKK